ncbi:hypothetical protein PTSG_07177 [Salpingoeca rosetta]|uniref:Major facilitator superfamily (MFS) profile domain-containing protein n=1 Tax=Salpingoeca rosetta (strain ATCC 50818 / BSB-021) TaxID=946362 RepID=F2UEA2_SALR5|nr:uncharacterized protein PTSG_07177 [Salpingoeca rosetta]EGD74952.1 hypothetical protein PTSG_07177 [Salpingoeca rosetta]|eukprot:XP_004992597.1 hypothetical protein PTSG_07177 [Salpingoeca rosetta]
MKKQATPLPVLKVAIISAVLFANQYSGMVIFPFLAFMTHDFFPELDRTQLGTYAGILGSAFHCGSLAGSIAWGRLADKHGRRPIMLLGILGTLAAIVGFGFSTTFGMAVFFRFLWGALNGNIGVAKAYLSEVCDETNQARGFSVIGLGAGVGRLLGPATGAFLARPAQQFPAMFGDSAFFKKYPYLLPCLVGGIVCIVCFVLAFLFLEETMPRTREQQLHVIASRDGSDHHQHSNSAKHKHARAKRALRKRSRQASRSDVRILDAAHEAGHTSSFAPSTLDEAEAQQQQQRRRQHTRRVGDTGAADAGVFSGDNEPGGAFDGTDGYDDVEVFNHDNTCDYGNSDNSEDDSSDPDSAFHPLLPANGKHQHHRKPRHDSSSSSSSRKSKAAAVQELTPAQELAARTAQSGDTLSPRSVVQLAFDRGVGISTALYGLVAFVSVIAQEVLPLYMLTAAADGGLNLNLQDIGLVVLYAAPAQIFTQVIMFPSLSKRFGYVGLYKFGLTLFTLWIILIPELPRVSPPRQDSALLPATSTSDSSGGNGGGGGGTMSSQHYHHDAPAGAVGASWVHSPVFLPALLFALTQASIVLSFTSTFVLINNSCPPHERGTANGLGQSYAALGRASGPAIGGAIFAWSAGAHRAWPFDYHFVWYVAAAVCVATYCLALRLPESVMLQATGKLGSKRNPTKS